MTKRQLESEVRLLAEVIREQNYRLLLRPSPLQILRAIRDVLLVIAVVVFALFALRAVAVWTFSIPDAAALERQMQQQGEGLAEAYAHDEYLDNILGDLILTRCSFRIWIDQPAQVETSTAAREACLNMLMGTPAPPVTAAARCEEDQPCWNCRTMGNKICG